MRRLVVLLFLVLAICLGLAASPVALGSQPPVSLVCLSPPDRLEVPAGQGLLVCCRLAVPAGQGRVESVLFRVNGLLLDSSPGPVEDVVAFAWRPSQVGWYTLAVTARAAGRDTATASRLVRVVPAGSPVRLP